ncbi:hypothetical protein Moror_127 [Moniliophthora roreri MCA 2997]|uniref:SCP domain-containing protein n=1 Tax=Moniliophthora roreri (strain MCA 2997) TaxID=1381753 RepID=V2XX82_MONRO|nr:hypothetical protein Moror_127 [Moniliophthora roreri MCA 2997]
MTRLALLVACVALFAVLPYGSAGPACAKKYWQQQQCVEKCKAKWGYPGSMMGTDRWGSVMQKTDTSTEAWNAALAKACGVETTSTSSQTVLSTNFSVSAANFLPTTLRLSTSIASSSSSSETTTSTEQETASEPQPPIMTSSSSSETTTSTERETTSELPPPPPTTTSQIPPSPTTSSTIPTAPTQDSGNNSSGNSGNGGSSSGDIEQYLEAHNSVRAQHGAQPLTWSDEAASKAQQWANNCKFEHSGGSLGSFGENLAAGTSDSYTIARAVKGWTDEVSDYDPNNPKASHFTQVVWKATTQVGCALVLCDGIFEGFGKARYYVCEYTPQGNVGGQFAANVQA